MNKKMTREEALSKVKGYLTDLLPSEEYDEVEKILKALEQEPRWIPVSERLPKEDEYVDNVCKYYLIQDEYGDMHVAHLSNVGWIPMDSLKTIGNEIIAWQELPEAYVPEINIGDKE